ncbi:MAG: ATP-binding protein, partial [Paracoccus sp. (in: a-proteobacteria)]
MTIFDDTPLRSVSRILIANRGEIAGRIIRACRDEGIASVAVYADPDRDAPFVALADEAFTLEGSRPADTYLDTKRILAIAARAGVDAVHPGYGFLSESADFARAVQDAGLIWIGPDPETIEALGDKIHAREIARAVGAPLATGSDGPVGSAAEAMAFARDHGLPVAIKAAFGGGGRGMKVAWTLDEVEERFDSAVREAVAAFGRGECYVEQFLDRPRHLEVQVLADRYGTVKVLGTRDCSLQRRNQKLVEEAPAPFLTPDQQDRLITAARSICAQAGYCGAGTVEF